MTNQQGAPEALRHADGLESFAQMLPAYGFNPQPLKDAASELRRLAALVEAQQPATCGNTPYDEGPFTLAQQPAAHVQNPAEIEHVADVVSKNGAESNMAQQPAPSGAPADPDGEAFRTAARLGLTLRFYGGCAQSSMPGTPSAYEVVTGQDRATAMREAVERAEAVIAAGGKPLTVAPLSMPDLTTLTERGAAAWAGVEAQALREGRNTPAVQEVDIQPAPGRDERDDFEKVFPLPSGCIRCGTGYASTSYSIWAAHTHCDRWHGWQARAARALACSAELERLQGRIARIGIDVDRALRGDVNPQSPLGTTRLQAVAAQAADSVLEDAARLERERICAAIKAEDDYCVDQGDYMLDSDDCIKIVRGEWVRPDFAIDAARKQGANHD